MRRTIDRIIGRNTTVEQSAIGKATAAFRMTCQATPGAKPIRTSVSAADMTTAIDADSSSVKRAGAAYAGSFMGMTHQND